MTRATIRPPRILIVTGLSGAGKSTTLRTLEDMGWEVVDNLPLTLLDRLLSAALPEGASEDRPLAIGIDSRTRGFDADAIVRRVRTMRAHEDVVALIFLDCADQEIERRYSETRRRHPLAPDRPAADGIARERVLTAPLRDRADALIDTTALSAQDLRLELRSLFAEAASLPPALTLMSFGYARGVPRQADLVFDLRFLRNPYWVANLRALTGLDEKVATYVRADPAYGGALDRIADLLLFLLPRYQAEGKAYVTIGFGCTGGHHRSVHFTRAVGDRLHAAGFCFTIMDRDLGSGRGDSPGAALA